MRSSTFLRLSLFAVCAPLLTGCSPSSSNLSSTARTVQISGKLHGGQQPVAGSTIQVYAVGTTADASAATPLFASPVTTGSDGSFSLATGATCPSNDALVYLVATSGNPGFSNGNNNAALAMMAALGPCGQIGANSFIYINELTTVASIAALYPYASSYTNIGSGTSDATQLTAAFTAVNEYTNVSNGTVPGPTLPSGFYASSNEIGSLANILSACVNSGGGTANDGSPCGILFSLAKPSGLSAPANTVDAIIDILKYPNPANVAALYNLSPPVAPFQPSLTAMPADWTLPILAIPATPTFSLAPGYYPQAQSLTLSDTTPGASIYYTLDGSTPTASSLPYTSSPIQLSVSKTVKVIAVTNGKAYSPVASAAYSIALAPASIVSAAGSNQSAAATAAFANPLQVQVFDSTSRPVAGITVTFANPTSGASANLGSSTCVTDNSGLCSVLASAGPSVGGPYTVTASAGALSTTFSLTNTIEAGSNNFVVTVATDTTTGVATNCVDQSSGSSASNASCSLRDAIQAATQNAFSPATRASIHFAQTVPTTITLTHGNLNLPSYTTIQGATTAGGAANLITLDGNYSSSVFIMNGGFQAVLNNLVFTHGSTSNLGGGIYQSGGDLTVNNSTFTGNTAGYSGGAISNNGGTLTLNNDTFNNNQATTYYGGALDNFTNGILTVTNSTFTANTGGTDGGAIYSSGTANITNSTIAGNTAPYGAGVYNKGTMSVSGSILSGNSTEDCGGFSCAANWVYVSIANTSGFVGDSDPITIAFTDNFSQSYSQTVTYGQFSSPLSIASGFGAYFTENFSGLDTATIGAQPVNNYLVISPPNSATILNPITITNPGQSFVLAQQTLPFLLAGHQNIFGVTAGQTSTFGLTSGNANLGPLADNGGPTKTMLPLAGSAALCAISPSTATGTDQRGQPRAVTVNATTCQDAGAVQTNQ